LGSLGNEDDSVFRRLLCWWAEAAPIRQKLGLALADGNMFVLHAGKVLTHRQLLREVWGPNAVEQTHYLRVYMTHLREKLEIRPIPACSSRNRALDIECW